MLNIDELDSDYVPTTCASDVEITTDDCSENSYFPKHKCSFITGYSDAGKNYFSCGVAACISRGIAIPGEFQRDVGEVLILSTEWDLDDLKYRLLKCNADMDHIHIIDYDGVPLKPLLSKDLAEVKSYVDQWHPQLIILEAWQSYYGKRRYLNSEIGVYQLENYLNGVATELDCHLMLISHDIKKPYKAFPWCATHAYRIINVGNYLGYEERVLLPVGRCNSNPYKSNYAFRVTQKFSLDGGKVTWLGESPMIADDYFYSESHKRTVSNVVEAMKLRLANKR